MEDFEKKKIINNIGWLSFSKIIIYFLAIITITVVPRYLGVDAYGQLNFVLSFLGIFMIITDLGINTLIFRDVSKNKKLLGKYFNNFLPFKLILFLISAILIVLLTFVLNKPSVVNNLFYILIIYLLFSVLSGYLTVFYNSMQDNKFYAIYEAINKVSYVLFIFLIIYLNFGVIGILFAQIFSLILGFLFLAFFFKKYIPKVNFKLNPKFIKQKLYLSWPFALNFLFYNVYFHFDKILISLIINDYSVGLYAISYSFLGFLMSVVGLIALVFFPVLSKYSFSKDLPRIFNKYLKLVSIVIVPLSFGAILLSKEIIYLVFGASYVGGNLAFKIIMLFCLFSAINSTFNNLFIVHHFEKYFLKLLFIASVSNVVLNLIVIPFYGIVGAAITTLVSELIILIGAITFIKNKIKGIKIIDQLVLPLISGTLMIFGLFVIRFFNPSGFLKNNFDVLIYAFIGGLIYFSFILLFKVVTKKEISSIYHLVMKK
jgi:O-antigen/teichoic acid export membrane protein